MDVAGSTMRQGANEARDNAAFAAILAALSRPGTVQDLPMPGEWSVMTALIDRECAVHAADPALRDRAGRLGGRLVDVAEADHVLLGAPPSADLLGRIDCGSDLYPDRGATVLARALIGQGPPLRLTGPGIDGAREVRLGGLPDGFWAARDQAARYPRGFDLLLVDGATLVGVPRSTRVEVL